MPQSNGAASSGGSRGKRSPSARQSPTKPGRPTAKTPATRSPRKGGAKSSAGTRKSARPARLVPVHETPQTPDPGSRNIPEGLDPHPAVTSPTVVPPLSTAAGAGSTGSPGAVPLRRDLSAGNQRDPRGPSQIVAEVCDRHWLRARWSVTRESVRRAEARLATEWHRAVPVLRLFEVRDDEGHTNAERFVREAQIDSETHTWYLPVPAGGTSYRVMIGYRGSAGTFFALAKSNLCQFPRQDREAALERLPGGTGAISDDASPSRPLGFSALRHFGPQATRQRLSEAFGLQLAIEVTIHGQTLPGSIVTVQQDPLEVREDGSFTYRVGQPEGRQVMAIAAVDLPGKRRQVVVLGLERNTKELEQQSLEEGEGDSPE